MMWLKIKLVLSSFCNRQYYKLFCKSSFIATTESNVLQENMLILMDVIKRYQDCLWSSVAPSGKSSLLFFLNTNTQESQLFFLLTEDQIVIWTFRKWEQPYRNEGNIFFHYLHFQNFWKIMKIQKEKILLESEKQFFFVLAKKS